MAGKSKAKNKGRGSNSNAADSLDSNSKTVASSLTAKSSDGDALESLTNGREDHQSSSVDGVMDSKAETANPSTVTSKPAEGEFSLRLCFVNVVFMFLYSFYLILDTHLWKL